jgi:hypothetical protein
VHKTLKKGTPKSKGSPSFVEEWSDGITQTVEWMDYLVAATE